jgi:hypothetical protein
MQPILFYDIPSRLPVKDRAWSPNTWKIRQRTSSVSFMHRSANYTLPRWTLNYKQLSYKTVWVEYPDIEALSLEIGAEPAHKRENGDPYYTLPIIKDPNTDKIISDSHNIALYLDETYPERQVMPKGTAGLFFGFQGFLWEVIEEVSEHVQVYLPPLNIEATIELQHRSPRRAQYPESTVTGVLPPHTGSG